jgi:hypothetical protein
MNIFQRARLWPIAMNIHMENNENNVERAVDCKRAAKSPQGECQSPHCGQAMRGSKVAMGW